MRQQGWLLLLLLVAQVLLLGARLVMAGEVTDLEVTLDGQACRRAADRLAIDAERRATEGVTSDQNRKVLVLGLGIDHTFPLLTLLGIALAKSFKAEFQKRCPLVAVDAELGHDSKFYSIQVDVYRTRMQPSSSNLQDDLYVGFSHLVLYSRVPLYWTYAEIEEGLTKLMGYLILVQGMEDIPEKLPVMFPLLEKRVRDDIPEEHSIEFPPQGKKVPITEYAIPSFTLRPDKKHDHIKVVHMNKEDALALYCTATEISQHLAGHSFRLGTNVWKRKSPTAFRTSVIL